MSIFRPRWKDGRMRYLNREDEILKAARGKRVLHLGCVGFTEMDRSARVALAKESLHYKLSAVADVVGIDYAKDVVDDFLRSGVFNNIVYGNAEHLDDVAIDGPFDLIVVGDLIEHLSNPGSMLAGLGRFCNSTTSVIITTPHAFGLPNFVRYVFGVFREGADHVMSFNGYNLSHLLDRHGFRIDSIDTCFQAQTEKRGWIFSLFKPFLCLFPKFGGTLYVRANLHTSKP